jgi:hypothetical protein
MNDTLETLQSIRAYLDERADCDRSGLGQHPVPNEAMRLLVRLDQVIAELKAPRGWK